MITEDFTIGSEWVTIPLRADGTFVYIADIKVNNILAIIGDEVSISEGLILKAATDSLRVNNQVQVKTDRHDRIAEITVIRD